MICHSRPKRGWNIFESLKSCQMTESEKNKKKLNMFSVLDEQIKSLNSKQSKSNFWNQLKPKFAFLCRLLNKTATWRPNHPTLKSSVTAILKAITDTVFGIKFRGGQTNLFTGWMFFQWERVLWGWLPGPSRMSSMNIRFQPN